MTSLGAPGDLERQGWEVSAIQKQPLVRLCRIRQGERMGAEVGSRPPDGKGMSPKHQMHP